MLAASALLILASVPAYASDVTRPVWFSTHQMLYQLDPATHLIAATPELSDKPGALAVTPEGDVWVLGKKRLRRYDATQQLRQEVEVSTQAKTPPETLRQLLLNPYDGSLWVAGKQQIFHLDARGKLLSDRRLPDKIKGLSLDIDETLWVFTAKQLLHLSSSATLLYALDLKGLLQEPKCLALDHLGSRLWLADERQLLVFDIGNLSQPLRRLAHAGDKAEENLHCEAMAVHPLFGTLWALTKSHLLIYDRDGNPLKQTELSAYNLGEANMLTFDPANFGLWIGGKKAIGRFQSNGEFVARLPVKHGPEVLAAVPFTLVPTLALVSPSDGALTNNAHTPLHYRVGGDCTGTPCLQDSDYTHSFSLDVDLNGLAVGSLFTFSPGEVTLIPGSRLPEGLNFLTARATDRYGHLSRRITSRFTIDTVPPKFISLSPADGSRVISGLVTVQGSLDDPAANVTLHDASGSAINLGAYQFAFSVVLREGWNVFTLVARDPAGNQSPLPWRVYLNAADLTVSEPAPGSTVSTDSLLVAGRFSGPENTGIAVNGMVAIIDGDQYYVNNLPLNPGENTLTITLTRPDGTTRSHIVTVTRTGSSPLHVAVAPQSGVPPLTASFTARLDTDSIQRINLDGNGDGTDDISTTNPTEALEYLYSTPGVYRPRITVIDTSGQRHTQTQVVVVQDPQKMDQLFRNLWNGMNSALTGGDIARATGYLNESAKRKYQPVFEALLPYLPQIVASYSPPHRVSVSENIGEYAINRLDNGRNRLYLVYFLKDTDGVWRLDEM